MCRCIVGNLVSFWHWPLCSVTSSPVITHALNRSEICFPTKNTGYLSIRHPSVTSSSLSKYPYVDGTAPHAYTWRGRWLTADTWASHYTFIHSAPCLARDVTEILLRNTVYQFYWLMWETLYVWNAFFEDASLSNTVLAHREPWWKSSQSHCRDMHTYLHWQPLSQNCSTWHVI